MGQRRGRQRGRADFWAMGGSAGRLVQFQRRTHLWAARRAMLSGIPATVATRSLHWSMAITSLDTQLGDNGTILNAVAVTLGNGTTGTSGAISSANSVLGTVADGISGYSYDTTRNRLVVGRGPSNIVSIFALDPPPLTGAEIIIEQPIASNIADGGGKAFGSVMVGSSTSLTFTIKNIGPDDLTLGGTAKVAVSGADASMFTVTTQPSSPVMGTNGTTTFIVQFAPTICWP